MPAFMLKKIVLRNFAKGPLDSKMADAIDFMVDRVSGLQSQFPTLQSTQCFHTSKHTLPSSACSRSVLESEV